MDKAKIMFNKAKNDEEFKLALKLAGEEKWEPKWYWDRMDKGLFAMGYFGYMVAKGFTEEQLLS